MRKTRWHTLALGLLHLLLHQLSLTDSLYTFEKAHGRKHEFFQKELLHGNRRDFDASLTFSTPSHQSGTAQGKSNLGTSPTTNAQATSPKDDGDEVVGAVGARFMAIDQFGQKVRSVDNAIGPRRGEKSHPLDRHWVLRFDDLPVWRAGSEAGKRKKDEKAAGSDNKDLLPTTYDPIKLHILAQSYIYPDSNSLTQADRDYFRMIRSENGFSDFEVVTRKPSDHESRKSSKALRSSTSTSGRPNFTYHRVHSNESENESGRDFVAITLKHT